MTAPSGMTHATAAVLHGAFITPYRDDLANASVSYFLGDAGSPPPAEMPDGLQWAVYQGNDSFAWGVFVASSHGSRMGEWRWATLTADLGRVSASRPRASGLIELRVFGEGAELLLWNNGDRFVGRLLRDADPPEVGPFAPLVRRARFLPVPDEEGKLSGTVVPTADPLFVRRTSGDGRTTVTPVGDGVETRDYLQSCTETGNLRIAATRFVRVYTDGQREQ